jgi:rRNA maturation endonuclease Nob1
MAEEADFKCLRCQAEFKLSYTPGVVEERACPKCGSNSVRRIKKQEKKDK